MGQAEPGVEHDGVVRPSPEAAGEGERVAPANRALLLGVEERAARDAPARSVSAASSAAANEVALGRFPTTATARGLRHPR